MYMLVARLDDALGEMRDHLESHICAQGLAALEELGESGGNVMSLFYESTLITIVNVS